MRVKKQGDKNPIPVAHCNFLIYDETNPIDELEEHRKHFAMGGLSDSDREAVLRISNESWRHLLGRAYGFARLCYFTVYKDGNITFEFDSDKQYTLQEIKQITSLAHSAKRRCQFA